MKTNAWGAIALTVAMCIGGRALAETKPYTMKDLQALAANETWIEVLQHMEDVRPGDRNQAWNKLLESAAIGHLSSLAQQQERYQGFRTAGAMLQRYPALTKSKPYMNKRGEVGLLALGECFNNRYGGNQCVDELEKFVKGDPKNSDLWFKAGKLVVEKGRMARAASPFFATAMENKKIRKTGCSDDSVANAVMQSLGSPPRYDSTKAVMKVAFDQCYGALKGKLVDSLYGASGYDLSNLCAGLTKKKAKLTKFQKAVCKDALSK